MPKVKLRLVDQGGNAFGLLGSFQTAAKKAGWSEAEIQEITTKAIDGDYYNLLRVLSEHCENNGF